MRDSTTETVDAARAGSAAPEDRLRTRARARVIRWALLLAPALIAPVHAQVVVNEIDYDQVDTDAAEFVEIRNVTGGPVNLADFELHLVNGTNGDLYETIELPMVPLPSGGYFVICANAATVPNCDLDVDPDTNLIQNGAPDAVAVVRAADGAIVDTVSYEGDTVAPYTEGSGVGLEDASSEPRASVSRFPDGIDTAVNNLDLSLRCATPGAANAMADGGCEGGGTFSIEGSCPGEITLTYSGGTPDGVAGIVFSRLEGSDPLTGGPCAGTETELDAPRLLTALGLDDNGEFGLVRVAPPGACGALVQIVDGATCALSDRVSVPEPGAE